MSLQCAELCSVFTELDKSFKDIHVRQSIQDGRSVLLVIGVGFGCLLVPGFCPTPLFMALLPAWSLARSGDTSEHHRTNIRRPNTLHRLNVI